MVFVGILRVEVRMSPEEHERRMDDWARCLAKLNAEAGITDAELMRDEVAEMKRQARLDATERGEARKKAAAAEKTRAQANRAQAKRLAKDKLAGPLDGYQLKHPDLIALAATIDGLLDRGIVDLDPELKKWAYSRTRARARSQAVPRADVEKLTGMVNR